jgi:pimeloyl-ACP methyl ester carboxylesterase
MAKAAGQGGTNTRIEHALNFAKQAEKLSLQPADDDDGREGVAVQAKFITPLDPVIETADGHRLPGVPVDEAHKLNQYKAELEGQPLRRDLMRPRGLSRFDHSNGSPTKGDKQEREPIAEVTDTQLEQAVPPSRTHPLFPPLPLYGPASWKRDLQCATFRVSAFFLSTGFLLVIVLGAIFTSIPKLIQRSWLRLTCRDPDATRPFYAEERRRQAERIEQEREWVKQQHSRGSKTPLSVEPDNPATSNYQPTEGGADKLICDIGYYARRVGLDCEEFTVQTEDGFFLSLYHIYDPSVYTPGPVSARGPSDPQIFTSNNKDNDNNPHPTRQRFHHRSTRPRYPVLLIHGLLQSAGAYCSSDDSSLAFYLCKAGYDVWLGNNRCGFSPRHALLRSSDPRMWAWNIRQMGVLDLPAFVSRVLCETGFEKLGLVAHSQGTTQSFVALAKEQRPELGEKLSVLCALAPAVYAGGLVEKMYFKFMRVISPGMFRVWFGVEAFIPLMMTMHRWLPGRVYGAVGYLVFSFLFDWSDKRWNRGLRDRLFQFSPVYVSAESMRWWLGRECFAKHKCILDTKEAGGLEDVEDEEAELKREGGLSEEARGKKAWYDERVPPMALWVAGSDELVDGRRLLRRFERGREPHARIVHSKVIEEYEHLDVIWAMDAIDQVGSEVKQVLWDTMRQEDRDVCRSIDGVKLDRAGGDSGSRGSKTTTADSVA